MKKTRGVISDTLKRSCKSKSQAEFTYENCVIRNTDEIANHFNDYSLTFLVHYHNKFNRHVLLITT